MNEWIGWMGMRYGWKSTGIEVEFMFVQRDGWMGNQKRMGRIEGTEAEGRYGCDYHGYEEDGKDERKRHWEKEGKRTSDTGGRSWLMEFV